MFWSVTKKFIILHIGIRKPFITKTYDLLFDISACAFFKFAFWYQLFPAVNILISSMKAVAYRRLSDFFSVMC